MAKHIDYYDASSILTKPSGFAEAFDYSLNPYAGCAFACNYCYAAFFARTEDLKANWGKWVHVKANALELLQKRRNKPLIDKMIYMSTVTDPYQPIEAELELTRAILEELLTYHQVRLMVQTRGTLVTRDIDLLRQFPHVQVNMTITTDDDAIRRVFEPTCPSIDKRFEAIETVHAAGIPVCVSMTPLLPVRDPDSFVQRLRETGAIRYIVQAFHPNKIRFAAGTGEAARHAAAEMGWTPARYAEVREVLSAGLQNLYEGKPGFVPDWA